MALQNIGASNRDDAFYRYKMPRMVAKIEGRGNGIKTNVVNMVEIAKALARPASYTTKYFGCELGAQSKFDEKTGTSLVNGAHDTAKLAALLENFIKKYVQCYGCGNPETEIVITKTQMITLKCAACGFVSDVDMRDKLTTFIIKNPPEQKKGSKDKKAMRRAEKERLKEGEAADEEQKKHKKEVVKKKGTSGSAKDVASKTSTKKKSNSSDEDHSPAHSQADENDQAVDDDDDGDVQWQTDTSLEAARQRIQEQLSAATADMVMLSTSDEKQKSAKNSPGREGKTEINGHSNGLTSAHGNLEEEKQRSAKNSPGRERKTEINGHSNGLTSAHGNLVDAIRDFLKKGSSVSQLKSYLGSLSGNSQEVMDALFEALFEGIGKGFAKDVAKKKNYLAAATQEEGSQMVLLRAIESFSAKASPEAVKEVALVLKALYDHDLLEESSVIEWYQQGLVGGNKTSRIWKNIEPFMEWLQNAESESEEE
jgi:translation initiation factor 5